MDTNTTILLILLILAMLVIFALLRFQQKGEFSFRLPWNIHFNFKGSNEKPEAQITTPPPTQQATAAPPDSQTRSDATIDQRGQTVQGPQTNIAGDANAPIYSGNIGQIGDRHIGDNVHDDKIDVRGGFYQPKWQVGTVNQAAGDIHNQAQSEQKRRDAEDKDEDDRT